MYDINKEIREKGLLEEYKVCVNDLEKNVKAIKKGNLPTNEFIRAIINYDWVDTRVRELGLDRVPGGDKDPFVECQNKFRELLGSFKIPYKQIENFSKNLIKLFE